jgi:UDP-glucose 6-dehydrogenase
VFLRQIAVVGAGYVGLTTAACLASLGHRVACADIDRAKVERLAAGEVEPAEPGLADLVRGGLAAGRLSFAVGAPGAVPGAEVVFLAVPTPMGAGGVADLAAVESVVREVRGLLAPDCVLVNKSANGFLAMKLSYVNAVAELCERLGADVTAVTEGVGRDQRIGRSFLSPGPGWGGSCLQEDAHALLQVADAADFEFRLLRAAIDTNTRQHRRMVEKVRAVVTGRRTGSLSGARLGLLGLAFKAGTDATVESPALAVAALLRQAGAELVGHDPAVPPGTVRPGLDALDLVDDPHLVAKDADALVVLTEWPQFRELDWARIAGLARTPVVVDTRNLLDPATLRRAGLTGIGLGRRAA